MAKKKIQSGKMQFTVTASGLREILNALENHLRGEPDGFVKAEVFNDGSLAIRSKDGRVLLHDDVEIVLED